MTGVQKPSPVAAVAIIATIAIIAPATMPISVPFLADLIITGSPSCVLGMDTRGTHRKGVNRPECSCLTAGLRVL